VAQLGDRFAMSALSAQRSRLAANPTVAAAAAAAAAAAVAAAPPRQLSSRSDSYGLGDSSLDDGGGELAFALDDDDEEGLGAAAAAAEEEEERALHERQLREEEREEEEEAAAAGREEGAVGGDDKAAIRTMHRQALSLYLKALWALEQGLKSVEAALGDVGGSADLQHTQHTQHTHQHQHQQQREKLRDTRQWLIEQFGACVTRAEHARALLAQSERRAGMGGGVGAGSDVAAAAATMAAAAATAVPGAAAAGVAAGGAGGGASPPQDVGATEALQLLYARALQMGREGTGQELLGQREGGLAQYQEALLLLEAIAMEPRLCGEDLAQLKMLMDGVTVRLAALSATTPKRVESASNIPSLGLLPGGGY
jgi:hypothetical protein